MTAAQSTRRGAPGSAWDHRFSPYLFVAPFFLVFALVGAFPLLFTGWVSLRDWDLIGGDAGFVGIDNFVSILTQPKFWVAVGNTFSIFVLSVVPQLVAATAIAVALSRNLRAGTFWRMGVLLPYVVAPVAVVLILGDIFGDRYGFVNTTLSSIGISPIAWHSDLFASHIAIASMVNFRWTGYNALILLAAMQAVPSDYYDAASIDGAGKLRQFLSVTLPSIRPTMIFVVITATVGGLQIFDEPRLYSRDGEGGPNSNWMTVTMYLYKVGWGQRDFGRAAAIAWILFVIIVLVGLANLAITRLLASDTIANGKRPKRVAK